MTIVPSKGIYITANYKETQLGDVRVGQPVDIKVDAYKGVTFQAKVAAIAPASQNTFSLLPAQNATGNFVKVTQRLPIRIVPKNLPKDKPLRVGMSVETAIKVKERCASPQFAPAHARAAREHLRRVRLLGPRSARPDDVAAAPTGD